MLVKWGDVVMKAISVNQALRIDRPTLGKTIPLSLWRLLRLVAMPRAMGEDAVELDRKIGLEFGYLLKIEKHEDISNAINRAKIGVCKPMEKNKNTYALEFTECFTCSGINPIVGEPICNFEAAIVEAALKRLGETIIEVKETKCSCGLGDKVCRIEAKVKGGKSLKNNHFIHSGSI